MEKTEIRKKTDIVQAEITKFSVMINNLERVMIGETIISGDGITSTVIPTTERKQAFKKKIKEQWNILINKVTELKKELLDK